MMMICSLEKKNDWFVHVSDVLERLKLCFWFSQEKKRRECIWGLYKQIRESFRNFFSSYWTRIYIIYINDRVSVQHNTYVCVSLYSIWLWREMEKDLILSFFFLCDMGRRMKCLIDLCTLESKKKIAITTILIFQF